ncbi:FK506-binding protein 39kD [Nomia melanderi]|uniref:FK506-binding protein 39kD n=1 Tax=Nomia melanderi TaxID=2448451 RepID=UPI003FCEE0FD
MFWGLIMEPNKRYTQVVEKSFHVSMASLDLTTADDNLVQVMLCYDNRNYLLCSLKKGTTWQVPLDLNFQEGTKIAFTCNGHGHVHLTGYVILDEDMDLDKLEEEEEEEEIKQLPDKKSKRKSVESPKNEKSVKRPKQEIEAESSEDEEIDLDDSDSDDSDEDADESLLMEEVEEDSDVEEDDNEEEEEQKKVKSHQKDKKNKQQQQQQQQQQQKKKEDTNKLVNGKDVKQDQQTKQKKNKGKQQQQQQQQQQLNEQNAQSNQKKRLIEGGVQVEELKIGSGLPAKTGKFVSVYYVGRLKNGKKFDSTTQGEGFKFRLGKGEVIKGWDVGIAGMKIGGKRRITIPPAMAYGARGSPPVIPGNSTLVFEVELRNVH